MKKLYALLLLTTGILGIFACCSEETRFYQINNFTLTPLNSLGAEPINNELNDSILMIRLALDQEFIVQHTLQNPFITSTIATSCDPPTLILEDPLTQIEFITIQPFNDFPAGSDIIDLIRLRNSESGISDLLRYLNMSFSADFQTSWISDFFDLVITEKPTNQTQHQFRIQFTFTSGRTVTENTEIITWL